MKRSIISILILVIGFIGGYYYHDYQSNKKTNAYLDSLGLLGEPNKELDECLTKVNPNDPLGIITETETQKLQREECISKYKK